MTARPLVDRKIIEALLGTEMGKTEDRRLLLVNARYEEAAPREFTARIGGRARQVRVIDEDSVLGIVDAWQRHRAEPGSDRLLVVASGVSVNQLGWDLRAYAVGRRSLTVDRAEIVKQLFGAAELDARMYRETWLLDALLDAEPGDGWPRGEALLTRDTAVRSLVRVRLGLGPGGPGDPLDLDVSVLLAWSRTIGGPARFAELAAAERAGITGWLTEIVGAAAPALLALVADGRGQDAMALGVLGAALSAPGAPAGASFALGGLFGGSAFRAHQDLQPFADAVTGTLARWIAEAESHTVQGAEAGQRVHAVLERADRLAEETDLLRVLRTDSLLPSGFRARLRDLAAALDDSSRAAEAALGQVVLHQLASLHPESCDSARMAVRLLRWLDEPLPPVESVARAVGDQVGQWGWVDRALTVLSSGDPIGDPVVGQAYYRLIGTVRERRASLDGQFARRLAAWTTTASQLAPGGALLIEDVLARLVVPLAAQAPPLVLVLDGMSAAVAAQLGDEIDRKVWTEVVPAPTAGVGAHRAAAVSMLPSVTTISRASLLTGEAKSGGQNVETAGFAAFWQRHRRTGRLFHKGRIGGAEGHRLAPALLEELAGDGVVGVVLNTIDDALDHGQEGARTTWRLRDVSHLLDLLNAARGYGRPVVLVADHGHVLDRSTPDDGPDRGTEQGPNRGPVKVRGAGSARWRTQSEGTGRDGVAGDGEVELSGPRVLAGGGTVVAPWREDIRYTPRRAGYHGGASLAEVTVPVLVFVPAQELLPEGWVVLPSERTVPGWWQGRQERTETSASAASSASEARTESGGRQPRPARRVPRQEGEGLFGTGDLTPVPAGATAPAPASAVATEGQRVVASARYKAQKSFVRRPPEGKVVAAVIDALAAASGRLTPDAVAAVATDVGGRSQRNAEVFVTVLQRLLNVEGYAVINLIDAGRTVELNVPLLKEQFGTEQP